MWVPRNASHTTPPISCSTKISVASNTPTYFSVACARWMTSLLFHHHSFSTSVPTACTCPHTLCICFVTKAGCPLPPPCSFCPYHTPTTTQVMPLLHHCAHTTHPHPTPPARPHYLPRALWLVPHFLPRTHLPLRRWTHSAHLPCLHAHTRHHLPRTHYAHACAHMHCRLPRAPPTPPRYTVAGQTATRSRRTLRPGAPAYVHASLPSATTTAYASQRICASTCCLLVVRGDVRRRYQSTSLFWLCAHHPHHPHDSLLYHDGNIPHWHFGFILADIRTYNMLPT